jgi:predicted transcriptional regulator
MGYPKSLKIFKFLFMSMITRFTKVTIIREAKPVSSTINSDLQWFCSTLGMFNLRDKEKSCYRLFVELLKAAKKEKMMSSDDLAERLGLTRATVIHHLNSLISAGLVVAKDGKYYLRVGNLKELVDLVESDIIKVFSDLKNMAAKLDDELELD